MDFITTAIPFVPILPLFGAIILGLFGKKIYEKFGEDVTGIIGVATPALAAVLAFGSFFALLGLDENARNIQINLAEWLYVADLQVDWTFRYDNLSAFMLLIITGIGTLIHIYAMGYMHGDKSFWRFFAYINLFLASMLMLVLGDNLLIMFLGWEGVGLCSYLLIGFWFDEEANAAAGKKAFLFNRVGDLGFITGMFLLIWAFYNSADYSSVSLSFMEIQERIGYLAQGTIWGYPLLEVIAICFFIGAMGKSAQLPLYVWLPDAMAGPTPVSALIHAATMVTAGVYMIARLYFLYSLAPDALLFIAWVGAITCFIAATIGMAQMDIKKVLAYSTVSQLGYMFIGMGMGAFSAGAFHLLTHAAFKAALFMGSGSIIVALHHQQDMRQMGGLLKKMPITGWSMIFGTLAIMGFPGTSGFFSKDEILEAAFISGNTGIWAFGFLAAGVTSFYMWRLIFMTFFGEYRGDKETWDHCHEQPKRTVYPIAILGVLSLLIGFLNVPGYLGGTEIFTHFLQPAVIDMSDQAKMVPGYVETHHESHLLLEWGLLVGTVAWTAFTGFLAYYLYMVNPALREKIMQRPNFKGMFTVLSNKYYVDEFYQVGIIEPIQKFYRFLSKVDEKIVDGVVNGSAKVTLFISQIASLFDKKIVDGAVNETAWMFQMGGRGFSLMQDGKIQALIGSAAILFSAVITVIILYIG